MKPASQNRIHLSGRTIEYSVVRSRTAKRLRVRVGPNGVEVLQPVARNCQDVPAFLNKNSNWILEQLERADRVRHLRRAVSHPIGEILFRGDPTRVRIEATKSRAAGNSVRLEGSEIVISRGQGSRTPVSRSLENWLRREARRSIGDHLGSLNSRLGQRQMSVYIMGQRTKWGNCSTRRNLSFNWRLILAPDYVLHYLVTHEAVHLAIPDHSIKFWLTVQSLCKDMEKAKQWLRRYQTQMQVELKSIL